MSLPALFYIESIKSSCYGLGLPGEPPLNSTLVPPSLLLSWSFIF
jgi:hypothetical protein